MKVALIGTSGARREMEMSRSLDPVIIERSWEDVPRIFVYDEAVTKQNQMPSFIEASYTEVNAEPRASSR